MEAAQNLAERTHGEQGMTTRKAICIDLGANPGLLENGLGLDGWRLDVAHDVEETRSLLAANDYNVGVAVFDNLNGVDWRELEEFFSSADPLQWVALASADMTDVEPFCKVIAHSFYDFHTLPVDLPRLASTLGHAYGMAVLSRPQPSESGYTGKYGMIGASAPMIELFDIIRRIGTVNATALISGESGTGKELAARAIHNHSSRRDMPFIAMNCGALPHHLIQAELFGYEKGAFTGAHQRKIGRIEAATGGTVFMDEIADLSLDLQVNLLRVLQEQTIERLGSNHSINLDVRIIAATNTDLEAAVREKRFREDLYYRLNVLRLRIPPLRERDSDVELIARFYLNSLRNEQPVRARDFSQRALAAMNRHTWPGNVRELINRIRQAAVMCDHRLIRPEDIGLDPADVQSPDDLLSLERARAAAEERVITRRLRSNNRNISMTARQLGISRVTLYRMMKKLGIEV